MSKQCTKPRRQRDVKWFQEKALLVSAQAQGAMLNEEELAFLADPGVAEDSATTSTTVTTTNAAYQCDDLDAYDSDCDDLHTAQVALMANLSRLGPATLSEVHTSDENMQNSIWGTPDVHGILGSGQFSVVSDTDSEINSDSNIIPYFRHLYQSQQETPQSSASSVHQEDLVMDFLEHQSKNDALNDELNQYKERLRILQEEQ